MLHNVILFIFFFCFPEEAREHLLYLNLKGKHITDLLVVMINSLFMAIEFLLQD